MPTKKKIDGRLFDRIIRRQIDLGRYAEKQVRDIIALLNAADSELLAKISTQGESRSFTANRLNRLLKETRAMIDDAYQSIGERVRNDAVDLAGQSAEFAGATLATMLPTTWSPVSISADQLAAIVDETPISVGYKKKQLLEDIFFRAADNKYQLYESVLRTVRLGMVQGETINQITQRLRGTSLNRNKDGLLESSRKGAASIVRTVVQHVNNQAAQAIYQKNSEVLNGWKLVVTLDSRTCEKCWSIDLRDKTWDINEGPIPPIHPQCRCFQIPVVKSWKELGFDGLPEFPAFQRASKDGPVDADISFNDWLKGQDNQTQIELLGPARAKLFSDGKLTLDKFTDSSGELYTLDELAERSRSLPLRGTVGQAGYSARSAYTQTELDVILSGLRPVNPIKVASWIDDVPPVDVDVSVWAKKNKGKVVPTGHPPGSILEIPSTVKDTALEPLLDHAQLLYQSAKGTAQATNAGYILRAIEIASEEKKYSVSVQLSNKGGIIGATSMEPYPDSIRIEHLGGLGGGAGVQCLLSAIRVSEKAGKKGAITLTPVADAVSWYAKQGFVDKPGSKYGELWLSPEAAKSLKAKVHGK